MADVFAVEVSEQHWLLQVVPMMIVRRRRSKKEGEGRAESKVLETLDATLSKIKEICSKDTLSAEDINAIHESTGVVLDLLLKRG